MLGTPTPQANTLAQARAQALLSDWRITPATLFSHLNDWWIPGKWLQYLSLEIASAINRGSCGLLISAPPRHGKSKLSTVATPLWVLENFPGKSVIVATYGEDLSTDFSREIRDLIEQNPHELNVRLRSDTKRVQNFLTTQGGGLKAVGLRGAITGRGADVLVIDDYIKEPKEAMSPTYLEDLWTWWITVARTRLEPGAVVIILATRWVADDLHGRIIKQQKAKNRDFFKFISLPAIYEPTLSQEAPDGRIIQVPDPNARDMLGRKYGDVLFPERYNTQSILDLREDLTNRWFQAMFQQKPLAEENVVINIQDFKRITRHEFDARVADWKKSNEFIQWGRSWDMASTAEAGDYSTGPRSLYHKATGDFYIESRKRGQWSAGRAEVEFVQTVGEDLSLDPDFKFGMEQEPGASGKYSVRHFENIARNGIEGTGHEGYPGVRVQEFPAVASKQLRAATFIAALEHGRVYVVVDHEEDLHVTDKDDLKTVWVREMFEEMEVFPEGQHDDQVDATVITYQLLSGKKTLKASIGRVLGADGKSHDAFVRNPGEPTLQQHRRGVTFGRTRPALILPNGVRRLPRSAPAGIR